LQSMSRPRIVVFSKLFWPEGGELNFLFIDGDHTYEGVRKNFEMYSPLVRRGGIVAFHDIVPRPPENVGGVPRF